MTQKTTIQSSISTDLLFSTPNEEFTNINNELSLFNDNRFLQGQTLSFGIKNRPIDNLGLSLLGAISNSQDDSSRSTFRSGFGHSILFNYDYNFKKLFTQGNIFYYSPNYYSFSNSLTNRFGGNTSFGLNLKRQSIGGSFRFLNNNLDEKSFGGVQSTKNLILNHRIKISKKDSLSTFSSVSKNKNDQFDQLSTNTRTTYRRKINRRLTPSLSFGHLRNLERRTNNLFQTSDITPGLTVNLGENLQHQLNLGSSFFDNGQNNQFIQTRLKIPKKPLVYQSSINRVESFTGNNTNWIFSNGLFYEALNGIRFGAEHIFSRNFSGSSSSSNNSFRLSLLMNLGFAEKKPYIASSTNTGSFKAIAFIDLNKDGK
ncbi:MAG: hypothetical protein QNJ31_07500 [Candidatus Caenarcaniphilales bacterium]|nr:hypothetical protein [Candidatus Caenarcaniphilales bacterium]